MRHSISISLANLGVVVLATVGLLLLSGCPRYRCEKDPWCESFYTTVAEAFIAAWVDYDYATMIRLLPFDKAEELRRRIDDQALIEGGTGRQRFPLGHSMAARVWGIGGGKWGFDYNVEYETQAGQIVQECWRIVAWRNLAREVRVDPVRVQSGECPPADEWGGPSEE